MYGEYIDVNITYTRPHHGGLLTGAPEITYPLVPFALCCDDTATL
jgi:hypothetical protein